MNDLVQLPKIEFDPQDVDFDVEERLRFWAALEPWFQKRGYYLYSHSYKEDGTHCYTYPQMTFSGKDVFPFAHLGNESLQSRPAFSLSHHMNARAHFAQDVEGRHLAIKLVKGDSEEYKINRLLSGQSAQPGVLPVLALLPYDGHWFVIMPRWSAGVSIPWYSTMAEVLDVIKCLLEGLAFLHSHRIFHRDISEFNTLVNHLPRDLNGFYNVEKGLHQKQLRAAGRLTYGIFDFNHSMMLPPGEPLSEYRLPICESFPGTWFKPWGVEEAQLDFNPFLYDVGCLGMFFCVHFQHLTSIVPMLAPLMDGMVTRNINARFTAAEALEFLESFRAHQDAHVLSHQPIEPQDEDWRTFDRWAGLPVEFVHRWSAYREPPVTFSFRVLQKVCEHEFGWRAITAFRKVARHLRTILHMLQVKTFISSIRKLLSKAYLCT